MRFVIPDLLLPDAVRAMSTRLEQLEVVDGRETAGRLARTVKHNQQLAPTQASPLARELKHVILANAIFNAAAWPKDVHSIRINRYAAGMSYGRHCDDPLMNGARCDLSFTLFLSAPEEYEGGELVVESLDFEHTFKLPAGSLLVYPSGSLHRVAPVTSGVRWAAVGWVHSRIRDHAQREILFDLDTARRSLFEKHGKTPELDLMSKSLNSLIRSWVE